MKCIKDNGIEIVYIDEYQENDIFVSAKYVLYNMQSHAYHKLPYIKADPTWVVTDVYRVQYKDGIKQDAYKVEFYYKAKDNVNDVYDILSIKTFMETTHDFRTDWFDTNGKAFNYKTIEIGGNLNPNYRKYEWTNYRQRFMFRDDEYNGPLKVDNVLKDVLNKTQVINNVHNEQDKHYAVNKVL